MKLLLTDEVLCMSPLPTVSVLVIDLAQRLGRRNCPGIQMEPHMSHFSWVHTCIPLSNGHTMPCCPSVFCQVFFIQARKTAEKNSSKEPDPPQKVLSLVSDVKKKPCKKQDKMRRGLLPTSGQKETSGLEVQ